MPQDELVSVVESAGFDASVQSKSRVGTVQMHVSGMTCASCSSSVERALNGVPGVVSAQVNLIAGKAEVRKKAALGGGWSGRRIEYLAVAANVV